MIRCSVAWAGVCFVQNVGVRVEYIKHVVSVEFRIQFVAGVGAS